MLNDIQIGRYLPGDSFLHRMDPRVKIVLLFFYLLLFTFGVHLFMTPGTALFAVGPLSATWEGLTRGVYIGLRLILLILLSTLLTLTTSPLRLTDGLEALLSPLRRVGVPVHELSMMMTIALRFIPTLLEELDRIMKAQKARGADFEHGSIVRRMRAIVPVLVPLFLSAFRRADELAMAMEARCYRGGEGRTQMKELHIGRVDYAAVAVFVLGAAGICAVSAGGLSLAP